MPLKPKPTPKTPQELEELIEVFRGEIEKIGPCRCFDCGISSALYNCSIDTLLFALGKKPKDFVKMTRRLKREHKARTEHHCSLSE